MRATLENTLNGSNPKARYSIYVVELDSAVLSERRFVERNPDYRGGSPCVYIGMTSRTPEERFEQHKSGGGLLLRDHNA